MVNFKELKCYIKFNSRKKINDENLKIIIKQINFSVSRYAEKLNAEEKVN